MLRLATSTSFTWGPTDGIHLRECAHCAVHGSLVSGAGAGLVIDRSTDVQVTNSEVRDSSFAGLIVGLSEDVEATGNAVTGTLDGEGIVVFGGSDVLFARNVSSGNGAGLGIQGASGVRVENNALRDNGFVGLYLVDGDDNVVDHNEIARNGDGEEGGIHLVLADDPDATSDGTVVSNNALDANLGDGLLVDAGVTSTLIAGNRATDNSDDGLDVNDPSATLSKNGATGNDDLGIEAVPGVDDAGGNRARGNGNPLECTNVFCR